MPESASRGVCLVRGVVCLVWGVWSGGVSDPGVGGGGVCMVRGGLPQCLVGYHPPP